MRNFANYDVDIHGKSSGVLKTICKKCLPTLGVLTDMVRVQFLYIYIG